MTEADKVFAGSIPAIYEKFMVPMIFAPYAEEIAARLAKLAPRSVLEIAAGTGVVTRAMARTLAPNTEIVATDLNQPMLDTAASLQTGDARVSFRQADALALPFESGRFDAAVCQFGVMFFPDKAKGYAEARRVLKPGGTYIVAVWDKVGSNEFIGVVTEELARRFPDDPPRFMERGPHGYHDIAQMTADARAGGFGTVTVETVGKIARADSALSAAVGYCQGNPLRGEIEARAPGELQVVTEQVAAALARRFGAGPIEGRIQAHILTATA
jgi:SAM-dependent methyltransferase